MGTLVWLGRGLFFIKPSMYNIILYTSDYTVYIGIKKKK